MLDNMKTISGMNHNIFSEWIYTQIWSINSIQEELYRSLHHKTYSSWVAVQYRSPHFWNLGKKDPQEYFNPNITVLFLASTEWKHESSKFKPTSSFLVGKTWPHIFDPKFLPNDFLSTCTVVQIKYFFISVFSHQHNTFQNTSLCRARSGILTSLFQPFV